MLSPLGDFQLRTVCHDHMTTFALNVAFDMAQVDDDVVVDAKEVILLQQVLVKTKVTRGRYFVLVLKVESGIGPV